MKLFVCAAHYVDLLPHFLRHYTERGITEFHVAAPAAIAARIDEMSQAYSVRRYSDLDSIESIYGGTSAVTAMRRIAQQPDEWCVIVDLDEFIDVAGNLSDIIPEMEAEGANLARGVMLDRFSVDGLPRAVTGVRDLQSLFPIKANFIRHVMGGCDIKGILVKGHLRSRIAHHCFHEERPFSTVFDIAHYKWTEGAIERLQSVYDSLSRDGVEWASEYKLVLDHFRVNGRFDWRSFGGRHDP